MRGRASKTDNYTRYTPWENPGWYEGSIVFTCGNKRFRLERNFGKPAEEAVLFCETDGELLSVSNGDLDMLLGNISESVYRNTVSAGQMKSRTEEGLLAELRDYMANFQGFGDLNLNPEKALVILKDKKKEWEKKEQKELFDRQKLEEELQYRIQYETEEIENLEEKIGELEKEKQELEKGEESGYKETGSERKAGISFSRLILYVFFVVSGCLGVVFLRFSWIIPLVFLLFAVLAEIFISRKSDWSEQEIPKFSMDRRGKIKEQKNVLQTSLEERKVRLYNLKEELQEVCADNEKITEIRKEIRAIVTAASLIKEVSGKMQGSAGKILKDKMSEILSEMTCGKYCRVVLDEDFNISLDTGSRCLELHQVSHGTVEQVYLALRMACGEILCQEEELPVILDETFAMYDDNRLLQTLYWMSRRKSQVILFSCNKREIEALERGKISYHLIRLM